MKRKKTKLPKKTQITLLMGLARDWASKSVAWEAIELNPMTEEQQAEARVRRIDYAACAKELQDLLQRL